MIEIVADQFSTSAAETLHGCRAAQWAHAAHFGEGYDLTQGNLIKIQFGGGIYQQRLELFFSGPDANGNGDIHRTGFVGQNT